jgi:Protein of unknown function (DUF4031)
MVYVDSANIKYGRMTMCHMLADSLEELHEMADRIGVNRKWFQSKASSPHYDICLSKKALALQFGAKEVGRRELVEVIRRIRESK